MVLRCFWRIVTCGEHKGWSTSVQRFCREKLNAAHACLGTQELVLNDPFQSINMIMVNPSLGRVFCWSVGGKTRVYLVRTLSVAYQLFPDVSKYLCCLVRNKKKDKFKFKKKFTKNSIKPAFRLMQLMTVQPLLASVIVRDEEEGDSTIAELHRHGKERYCQRTELHRELRRRLCYPCRAPPQTELHCCRAPQPTGRREFTDEPCSITN